MGIERRREWLLPKPQSSQLEMCGGCYSGGDRIWQLSHSQLCNTACCIFVSHLQKFLRASLTQFYPLLLMRKDYCNLIWEPWGRDSVCRGLQWGAPFKISCIIYFHGWSFVGLSYIFSIFLREINEDKNLIYFNLYLVCYTFIFLLTKSKLISLAPVFAPSKSPSLLQPVQFDSLISISSLGFWAELLTHKYSYLCDIFFRMSQMQHLPNKTPNPTSETYFLFRISNFGKWILTSRNALIRVSVISLTIVTAS